MALSASESNCSQLSVAGMSEAIPMLTVSGPELHSLVCRDRVCVGCNRQLYIPETHKEEDSIEARRFLLHDIAICDRFNCGLR
jgi:hypothetical protein